MNASVNSFISNNSDFTTSEFTIMIRRESPKIGRSTIYSILKSLCDAGEITRISRGHFGVLKKKEYQYELSDTARTISRLISENHPLVTFQIWELYQMNEFVNHLLAHNTIFVDVENMLDESIFSLLFEKYTHVLYNPTVDEYYRYFGDENIVVRRLVSEAPPAYGEYKQASLEKILVDLFGRGIPGSIISRSEYPVIYEDSFKKYNINQARLFRYARRRGTENKIKDFIRDNTDIPTEADNDR